MSVMIIEGPNYLDTFEELAAQKGWELERHESGEIHLCLGIRGSTLYVSVTELSAYEALHFAFVADFKVPKRRHFQMQKLIRIINEHLWVGHFDLYVGPREVMFRHALLLAGQDSVAEACEGIMAFGRTTWERYLPALVMVADNVATPEDALQFIRFDTDGSA